MRILPLVCLLLAATALGRRGVSVTHYFCRECDSFRQCQGSWRGTTFETDKCVDFAGAAQFGKSVLTCNASLIEQTAYWNATTRCEGPKDHYTFNPGQSYRGEAYGTCVKFSCNE